MIDRASANPKIEFLFNHEVIDVLGEEKVVGLKLKNTLLGKKVLRTSLVYLLLLVIYPEVS
jgi:thioredoxin reductase (NADPH)